MHSSSPQLLSPNGRLLWQFCRPIPANDSTTVGAFLRCSDLLTRWFADYRLVGFRSIGQPVALYWLNANGGTQSQSNDQQDEKQHMILLDLNEQQGQRRFVSQRKIELDHGCREARWSGPMHWQHSTEITEIVNVIVGQENVVLIGQHSQMNWNGNASQLVLPLCPQNDQPSEELLLAGMSPMLDSSSGSLNSFFFLGRPPVYNEREAEPRGMAQKLFIIGKRPCSGGSSSNNPLYAIPCVRLSPSFHSRLISVHSSTCANFPPTNFHHRLISQKGSTRLAAALFWTDLPEQQMTSWSVGCLDTKEMRWIGPLAEWTAPEGESAEAEISQDGGILLLIRRDKDQIKEIRSFRLPFSMVNAVPSLANSILLSIQCSSNTLLKHQSCELLGQLQSPIFS